MMLYSAVYPTEHLRIIIDIACDGSTLNDYYILL
ncbi:hypothetical protein XENE109146_05175 [Xenorhabdus nematophila]